MVLKDRRHRSLHSQRPWRDEGILSPGAFSSQGRQLGAPLKNGDIMKSRITANHNQTLISAGQTVRIAG
jgi:hypothetical protein